MFRRDLLRALAAAPLARWLGPWVPSAFGAAEDRQPNAADVYARAFEWAKSRPADGTGWLRQAATMPLDDRRVDPLLAQARTALEAIREAAGLRRCRWADDPESLATGNLLRGHLHYTNADVVRVTCLSARRHARSGRGREALDDLFAGLTLAHRIGEDGPLIAHVVEAGGEIVVFETLGRILPALGRGTLDELSRRLDALPPPQPASAAVGPESRYVLSSLRTKVMMLGPQIDDEGWAELGFGADQDATGAIKRLTGGDRARLLAHLDETGPAFEELARRLDLPWRQSWDALDEFVKAERSAQPVATGLVGAIWNHRIMVQRQRRLRAMVRAGIALVASGEAAFRTIADPSRTGPFDLERRGKGYLIRSAKDEHGMPEVTLAIGDQD